MRWPWKTKDTEYNPEIVEGDDGTELVFAEPVSKTKGVEKDDQAQRKRLLKQLGACICVFIVALAVILVILLAGRTKETDPPQTQSTNRDIEPDQDSFSNLISNDQCSSALSLEADGSADVGRIDSSMESTFSTGDGECGTATYGTGPGSWYEIVGTGDILVLSACSVECTIPTASILPISASLFSGTCEDLVCADGVDNLTANGPLEFATVQDQIYYLFIQGAINGGLGIFEVSLSD